MSWPTYLLYLAVMAGVTYLIRMLPLTVFRKEIKSTFIKSFLHYVPYAVLAAMTIPGILTSTGDIRTAAVGLVVAVVMAWRGMSGAADAAVIQSSLSPHPRKATLPPQ